MNRLATMRELDYQRGHRAADLQIARGGLDAAWSHHEQVEVPRVGPHWMRGYVDRMAAEVAVEMV